jgi:F-type H+-transporting ATPase subunit O
MAAARHLRSGLPLIRAHLAASESTAVAQGSRGFSSQVAKPTGKQVKVPDALYGGTGNYASALFLTAAKANTLDKVESEIQTVVEASKKSPLFSQFIKDLSVPKETRVKAITEIFAEAGFSDVTKNFLGMLPAHSFCMPN